MIVLVELIADMPKGHIVVIVLPDVDVPSKLEVLNILYKSFINKTISGFVVKGFTCFCDCCTNVCILLFSAMCIV